MKMLLMLALTALANGVQAAPPALPVPRDGSCPSGYYASGRFCVPSPSGRFAIERNGSCPTGYYASGNYCIASSDASKAVIHRNGACPGGYFSSGNYCVSSR